MIALAVLKHFWIETVELTDPGGPPAEVGIVISSGIVSRGLSSFATIPQQATELLGFSQYIIHSGLEFVGQRRFGAAVREHASQCAHQSVPLSAARSSAIACAAVSQVLMIRSVN